MPIQNKLSEELKSQIKGKASLILELKNSQAFAAYTKAVQELIDSETPKPSQVSGTEDAIRIASKLAFVQGLRCALQVIDSAEKTLKDLK